MAWSMWWRSFLAYSLGISLPFGSVMVRKVTWAPTVTEHEVSMSEVDVFWRMKRPVLFVPGGLLLPFWESWNLWKWMGACLNHLYFGLSSILKRPQVDGFSGRQWLPFMVSTSPPVEPGISKTPVVDSGGMWWWCFNMCLHLFTVFMVWWVPTCTKVIQSFWCQCRVPPSRC